MNKYDPSNYSVPSSGDAELDQRVIEDHIRSSMRIDEGLCPNHPEDAAELEQLGPSTWRCPRCGFVLHRSTLVVRHG
jgi:hypothetical protein